MSAFNCGFYPHCGCQVQDFSEYCKSNYSLKEIQLKNLEAQHSKMEAAKFKLTGEDIETLKCAHVARFQGKPHRKHASNYTPPKKRKRRTK